MSEGKSKTVTPIPYEEFQWDSVAKSGGLSGSVSIDDSKKQKYQFKFSVFKKKWKDKPKAYAKGFTDHENVGELIAGELATSVKKAMGSHLASPEINFVSPNPEAKSKQEKRGVNIVSKYLSGFRDMEGLFRDYTSFPKQKKIRYLTVDFTKNQNESGITAKKRKVKDKLQVSRTATLGIADNEELKQGLSDGVAMNALFGNVDVNAKGNMGLQTDPVTGKKNVAILDFGHGFNNLITQVTGVQKAFGSGGGLTHENGVLDYINREEVLGGKSKLWRDYKGLIPSEMFVKSLNKIAASQDQMLEGLQSAQKKLHGLSASMGKDTQMLEASLQRLNQNIGMDKVQDFKSVDELIDITMSNMQKFTSQRKTEMKEVAQVMDLQLKIDAHIKENPKDTRIPGELAAAYDKLKLGPKGEITWVKSDAKTPAKKANLAEYMKARKAELGVSKEKKTEKTAKRGSWVSKVGNGAKKKITSWVKHVGGRKSAEVGKGQGFKA